MVPIHFWPFVENQLKKEKMAVAAGGGLLIVAYFSGILFCFWKVGVSWRECGFLFLALMAAFLAVIVTCFVFAVGKVTLEDLGYI